MSNGVDFFKVIYERRSVRKFLPEPVPVSVLEQIVQAGLEAPTGVNAQFKQYVIVDDPAMLEKLRPISRTLATAPAIIAQLIEPKASAHGEYYLQDAAASIENMLLTTVALGYASCWVEGPLRRRHDEVRDILGAPADIRVAGLLPIGRPAETPERPAKPTVAEVTHYNRFGHRHS